MGTTASNFPNRPFRVEQRSAIYNQTPWNGGNSNLVHSEVWIIKNSYSPTWGSGAAYAAYVSGVLVGSNSNFAYDFRNSDAMLIHASDNWFAAAGDGNMYYTVRGDAQTPLMGYASTIGDYWAPRIIQPPGAPFSYPTAATALTNITATSMQYQFSGTTDGGSTIVEWQLEYSTDNFATWQSMTSPGASTVTGLIPGTEYKFRARGRNAAGWGAYSDVATAKTLASVRVSDGTSWLAPQVLVSTGTAWVSPGALVSQGGAWVNPLP